MEQTEITQEEALELAKREGILRNKAYVKQMQDIIDFVENIEKEPKKDRLDYIYLLNQLLAVMSGSVKAWQQWSNIYNMQQAFSLKELEDLYPKIKAIAKAWIDLDIEITMKKTNEVEEKLQPRTTPKRGNRTYLS